MPNSKNRNQCRKCGNYWGKPYCQKCKRKLTWKDLEDAGLTLFERSEKDKQRKMEARNARRSQERSSQEER